MQVHYILSLILENACQQLVKLIFGLCSQVVVFLFDKLCKPLLNVMVMFQIGSPQANIFFFLISIIVMHYK